MDVIMSHQQGFTQTVASMGTSLTEKQVGLLKKYTKNILLALDADAAGTEATLRAHDAITRAQEENITALVSPGGIIRYENALDTEIKVMVPPDGKDPDEVVRENIARWQQLVDGAQPLVDFILETVAARYDISQAAGKSKAAQELLPLIAEIKDLVRQAHYLQKLARLLGVEEKVLSQSLKRTGGPASHQVAASRTAGAGKDKVQKASLISRGEAAELHCLAMLVQNPELHNFSETISADYFENSQYREIFRVLQQSEDNAKLTESLDPALLPVLKSVESLPLLPATAGKRELEMDILIKRLKEMYIRRLWKAQESAEIGIEQLDIHNAEEMQKLFEQRHQKAKSGE